MATPREKELLHAQSGSSWPVSQDSIRSDPIAIDVRGLARLLVRNYVAFIPGAVALFCCTLMNTTIQSLLLALPLSSFMVAAAAWTLGYLTPGTRWAQRAGTHLVNLGALAGLIGAAIAPGLLFTLIVHSEHPTVPSAGFALLLLIVSGVPLSLVLLRSWTAVTIAFTYEPGEVRTTGLRRWLGPGLIIARRLTKGHHAPGDYTLPLVKYSFILFGGYSAMRLLLGTCGVPAIILQCVLYALVLPLWSLLLVHLGGRLHTAWREKKQEAATNQKRFLDAWQKRDEDERLPIFTKQKNRKRPAADRETAKARRDTSSVPT